MTHSRRALLGAFAVLSAAACASRAAGPGPRRTTGAFTHSVASGDPMSDSVVLWTRFVSTDALPAELGWEVAEDDIFQRIVSKGTVVASADADYCAKVIARGLKSGRPYWYRFTSASGASPVGRTRTAPSPRDGAGSLSMALFACSNLPTGWFNAYGHAAADETIDLAVHVGDYFYEYALSRYGDGALPGRLVDPFECVTLPQYYSRYASYRTDPDLLELHRAKPWVMTWDDHDFTNDSWMDGAENHQAESEGDWATRRAAAIKAHRDWTPTRASSVPGALIHRTLPWGRMADIIVLDSRMVGRTNQINWRDALAGVMDLPQDRFNGLARQVYEGPMSDPKRTILGVNQEAWFADQLARSSSRGATWQVVVEGSVLGASIAPASGTDWRAKLGAAGLPFDSPLWCGYPEARRRFLAACSQNGSNVLALGGETHSGWAFNLPGGRDGRPACVEVAAFAVAAGGKARGGPLQKGPREAEFRASSPEVGWCNLAECGYSRIAVTPAAATVDWIGFNDLTRRDAPPSSVERTVSEASPDRGASAWIVG